MILGLNKISISEFRKQIVRSHIPIINSFGLLRINDKLCSREIKDFFKNGNYTFGNLINSGSLDKIEEFLLVFNVEHSFLIKYSNHLKLDSFDFFKIIRKPVNFSITTLEYESLERGQSQRFKTIEKRKFDFSSDSNSFKEFYKFKRNSDFVKLISKYKGFAYRGKLFCYSKKQIKILEDISEFVTKYCFEIQGRQELIQDGTNLSASFRWKSRGIINNMLHYLIQIENDYFKTLKNK